jgi:putative restriction endonuclease
MFKFRHPVPIGSAFASRVEIKAAGLNRHLMAGIDYDKDAPAKSIVISGGYKDDVDEGDRIIYTGQGGQSAPGSGIQVKDQELIKGNKSLVESYLTQTPVMVIRGARGNKNFSPIEGYRYDGIYLVTNHWFDQSISGPLVVRFELIRIPDERTVGSFESESKYFVGNPLGIAPRGNLNPNRGLFGIYAGVKRDPAVPAWIKKVYKDRCQICGTTIRTPSSTYSEGSHIQPLGKPHNGPDTTSNMLCLCPNCHVMFDEGSYYLKKDIVTAVNLIENVETELEIHNQHQISEEVVAHHRLHVAGVIS